MPRTTQTDVAVLAVLSTGPLSGYAVREIIRDDLGLFWSESFGQIYPSLARLQKEGLVETVPGERRGSSLFRLTGAGRERIVELLREPVTTVPPRNGLLLRLAFGNLLGARACAELVSEARTKATAQLEELERIRRQVEAEPDEPQRAYALMTISAGEHAARAAVAWADETLAALESL